MESSLAERYRLELEIILNKRITVDEQKTIDKGLSYFQEVYRKRVYRYQGDEVYYNLLKQILLQGFDLGVAYEFSIQIINREIRFMDHYLNCGGVYFPRFYP